MNGPAIDFSHKSSSVVSDAYSLPAPSFSQAIVICSRVVRQRDSASEYQLDWRKLQQVGLNAYEARSYLVLMGHVRFKALELAARAHVPRQKTYQVLASLIEKGFACVGHEKTKLFSAIDPGLAISAYLARRSKALQNEITEQSRLAGGLIEDLRCAFLQGQDGNGSLNFLNLVTDPTQIAFHFARMLSRANQSYSEFVRQPFAVYPLDDKLVKTAVARNLQCRLLMEDSSLIEEHCHHLGEYQDRGLKVRFLDRLPMKLALFDNKRGLVSLLDPVSTNPSWTALIFEHDGFAEAMSGLFESYWSRSRGAPEREQLVS